MTPQGRAKLQHKHIRKCLWKTTSLWSIAVLLRRFNSKKWRSGQHPISLTPAQTNRACRSNSIELIYPSGVWDRRNAQFSRKHRLWARPIVRYNLRAVRSQNGATKPAGSSAPDRVVIYVEPLRTSLRRKCDGILVSLPPDSDARGSVLNSARVSTREEHIVRVYSYIGRVGCPNVVISDVPPLRPSTIRRLPVNALSRTISPTRANV